MMNVITRSASQAARLQWSKTFCTTAKTDSKRVAVILAGSGVYDGSEIHEASAVLVNLSRYGVEHIDMYAPNNLQLHVIDHTTGEIEGESRNTMKESARIARGRIFSLASMNTSGYDAVIVPGGFGVAKNLSNFAIAGTDCTVDPVFADVLRSMHQAKKPIGMCCIAPVLVAKVIPGCEVTMGKEIDRCGRWAHTEATGAVKVFGSIHVAKDVTEIHVDEANKIVTTPAFMCEGKWHEIHDGVAKMVKAVVDMIAPK